LTNKAAVAIGADAAARLRDASKVILWGLLLYGAVAIVGAKLSTRSFGALAVQMVLAEWGAGRLAVSWSDPAEDVPTASAIATRAGRGAALGLLGAGFVVLFALATHGLSVHASSPALGELGIALVTASLAAARDEVLLRGIPLRAFRHACPPLLLLLVCGGAAVAARYGVLTAGGDAVAPADLLVTGFLGVVFASLWVKDRGGWLAFGAHAAFYVATGGVIRGGLFDLRASAGAWGGGNGGLFGSLAMVLALVPVAAIAMTWSRRAQKR